jgi:hypothetical protein
VKTADEFLSEAAATFKDRNAIYGNNYLNVGKAMEGLFPAGLTIKSADDWNRLHIFLLGVIKQTRYANNWSAGGHADSAHDNTVYSAMLESIDAEIAGREKISVGLDFGSGDKTVVTLIDGKGKLLSSFEVCAACLSPETCVCEGKCLGIITLEPKRFAPCNNCATSTMCTQEDHCDREFNGYRPPLNGA